MSFNFADAACGGNSCQNNQCGGNAAFTNPTDGGPSLRQCNDPTIGMSCVFSALECSVAASNYVLSASRSAELGRSSADIPFGLTTYNSYRMQMLFVEYYRFLGLCELLPETCGQR
jgi:hypothetical protein